ncbi:MAG: choice-of-anchor V domain-containing protein [Bacteroidia bacterium]
MEHPPLLLPTWSSNVVTGYNPNQTYLINVGIQDPSANFGGFQIECLDALNNKSGSFSAGAGSQVQTVGAYEVVEHDSPSPFANLPVVGNAVAWTFSWTAPSTGGQVLTFYAVGNAVNGNGSTSGDSPYPTSLSFASLPVYFQSFESMVFDNSISLIWNVEEYQGAHIYLIERAVDQGTFQPIGEKAAEGQPSYRFTDHLAPLGKALRYRITQIDTDGGKQYSKVLSTIISPSKEGIVKVYPNPLQAGEALNLVLWSEYEGEAELRWLSMDGKGHFSMVRNLQQGENKLFVPSPQQAGVYMLEYKAFGKRETRLVQVH